MLYGYARVSTIFQENHLQFDALNRTGVDRIFHEKTSSVGSRPQLQVLLSMLRSGDVVVVYKIDRLARSLKDLLSLLERISAAGCCLRSLTEPLDTTTPMGLFMLQILGAVAQLERSIIRERSIAGQVAAYKRGVQLGTRRSGISERDVHDMCVLHASGLFTYPDLAAFFNVHPSTVKRHVTGKRYRVVMPVLSAYL